MYNQQIPYRVKITHCSDYCCPASGTRSNFRAIGFDLWLNTFLRGLLFFILYFSPLLMSNSGKDSIAIKIEKLSDSNLHTSKRKMRLVLMLRGCESTISTNRPFHTGIADFEEWTQKDHIVRAVVGPFCSKISWNKHVKQLR